MVRDLIRLWLSTNLASILGLTCLPSDCDGAGPSGSAQYIWISVRAFPFFVSVLFSNIFHLRKYLCFEPGKTVTKSTWSCRESARSRAQCGHEERHHFLCTDNQEAAMAPAGCFYWYWTQLCPGLPEMDVAHQSAMCWHWGLRCSMTFLQNPDILSAPSSLTCSQMGKEDRKSEA